MANMKKFLRQRFFIVSISLLFLTTSTESCYHYRVITVDGDGGASTEYQKKILWSYCWGLVNKPKDFVVPNCDSTALNEVRYTTNFGYALITVASLGILSPTKVEWKCHKPCQRIGDL